MNLPNRKTLPHTAPDFIRSGEIYFITVCGDPCGLNQFAREPAWPAIVAAAWAFVRTPPDIVVSTFP